MHLQFSLEVDHLILTERPFLKFASTTHGQCAIEIKDVLHQLQQTWLDLVKVVFAILEKELDAISINLLMDFPENVKDVLLSLKDHLKFKKAMSDSGNVCTIKCVPQQMKSIFLFKIMTDTFRHVLILAMYPPFHHRLKMIAAYF